MVLKNNINTKKTKKTKMERKPLRDIMDECKENDLLPFLDNTMCYTPLSKNECISIIRKKHKGVGLKGFIHSKSKNIKQILEDLAEEGSTFIHYEIVSLTNIDMFHVVKYLFKMNRYHTYDDGANVLSVMVEKDDIPSLYLPKLESESEDEYEGDDGSDDYEYTDIPEIEQYNNEEVEEKGYEGEDEGEDESEDEGEDEGEGEGEDEGEGEGDEEGEIKEVIHTYNKPLSEPITDMKSVIEIAKEQEKEHNKQLEQEEKNRVLLLGPGMNEKEKLKLENERKRFEDKENLKIEKEENNTTTVKKSTIKKIECDLCGKMISKYYLNKHKQTKQCKQKISI